MTTWSRSDYPTRARLARCRTIQYLKPFREKIYTIQLPQYWIIQAIIAPLYQPDMNPLLISTYIGLIIHLENEERRFERVNRQRFALNLQTALILRHNPRKFPVFNALFKCLELIGLDISHWNMIRALRGAAHVMLCWLPNSEDCEPIIRAFAAGKFSKEQCRVYEPLLVKIAKAAAKHNDSMASNWLVRLR